MPIHSSPLRSLLAGAGSILLLVLFLLLFFNHPTSSPLYLGKPSAGSAHSDLLQHVYNETLGFQKIFVINLPSRTDHRDSMALAAAFTGLQVEYVDGVTEVDEKVLPPGGKEANLNQGGLGAWRAHMNVARMIVEQGLTSALVLEDDADWDLRIKSQMDTFARASRLLMQPLAGTTDHFFDPTIPQPTTGQSPQNFPLELSDRTIKPTTSPFGDISRWDLLWLGHCGCRFPKPSDQNAPLGRAVIPDDETVPEKQHIDIEYGSADLLSDYPDHTRVVSRARVSTCTLAYGVSQPGARRLLHELGLRKVSGSTDMMFRAWCDGVDGRATGTCFTVQPQLFQHHRAVGRKAAYSDISDHGEGWNERAFSMNIRWSARLNLPKLVAGEEDWVDLFKDGEPKTGLGT